MKKVSKIIVVIAIILAFIIIPQMSFASSVNYNNILEWNPTVNQTVPTKLVNIAGLIIKLLRNCSIILTVLVITILGIKYMIGSVEQKAEYKKGYTNIIIGVALITMITTIIDAIFTAAQN